MIYAFDGMHPVIHESAFIHPMASVIGDVIIGRNVYIGSGVCLRGDIGAIVIEDGCNVQENCTVHMFPGITVRLSKDCHVGHGAIIHGATLGQNCLIGMNAVLMDHAIIGDHSIIGALTFVKSKMEIPPRSLVVGNPAKIIKQVSDEMIDWKSKGTRLYQEMAGIYKETLTVCEPLREVEKDRGDRRWDYKPWAK